MNRSEQQNKNAGPLINRRLLLYNAFIGSLSASYFAKRNGILEAFDNNDVWSHRVNEGLVGFENTSTHPVVRGGAIPLSKYYSKPLGYWYDAHGILVANADTNNVFLLTAEHVAPRRDKKATYYVSVPGLGAYQNRGRFIYGKRKLTPEFPFLESEVVAYTNLDTGGIAPAIRAHINSGKIQPLEMVTYQPNPGEITMFWRSDVSQPVLAKYSGWNRAYNLLDFDVIGEFSTACAGISGSAMFEIDQAALRDYEKIIPTGRSYGILSRSFGHDTLDDFGTNNSSCSNNISVRQYNPEDFS